MNARADVMVSGDADRLILGRFKNIRILAPRDALAMLATGSATDSGQSPNKLP